MGRGGRWSGKGREVRRWSGKGREVRKGRVEVRSEGEDGEVSAVARISAPLPFNVGISHPFSLLHHGKPMYTHNVNMNGYKNYLQA